MKNSRGIHVLPVDGSIRSVLYYRKCEFAHTQFGESPTLYLVSTRIRAYEKQGGIKNDFSRKKTGDYRCVRTYTE